jgi:ribosomal protein S14
VCYQDMSTRPRLIRSILKTLMVAHQRNRNKFPATKRNKKKYKELFLCGGSHTKFISTFRLCRVTVRDAASLGEKRLHAAWNIVSQSVAACVARRGVALRSMSWRIVSLFHFFIFFSRRCSHNRNVHFTVCVRANLGPGCCGTARTMTKPAIAVAVAAALAAAAAAAAGVPPR